MINKVAFTIPIGDGINVYWYGIIIATALIIAVALGVREAKRRGYRSEMVLDFMLLAIPLGIIFARVYYVVFSPDYVVYKDFFDVIAIWHGGLAIYGAVIGGAVAALIFGKWRKVSAGTLFDIAAPSIIIAQAIGRWGNFVNQEAYGRAITDAAWQWFPAGVEIGGQWHMATFFYESLWNVLVFAALMLLRKKIKVRGGVFALYLSLYGLGRFFIEPLRLDSLEAGGMLVSQVLSAVLFVGGILYIVLMSKKQKELPVYDGFYSLSWTNEQVEAYRAEKSKRRIKTDTDAEDKNENDTKADTTGDMKTDNKPASQTRQKKAETKKGEEAAEKNAKKSAVKQMAENAEDDKPKKSAKNKSADTKKES